MGVCSYVCVSMCQLPVCVQLSWSVISEKPERSSCLTLKSCLPLLITRLDILSQTWLSNSAIGHLKPLKPYPVRQFKLKHCHRPHPISKGRAALFYFQPVFCVLARLPTPKAGWTINWLSRPTKDEQKLKTLTQIDICCCGRLLVRRRTGDHVVVENNNDNNNDYNNNSNNYYNNYCMNYNIKESNGSQ